MTKQIRLVSLALLLLALCGGCLVIGDTTPEPLSGLPTTVAVGADIVIEDLGSGFLVVDDPSIVSIEERDGVQVLHAVAPGTTTVRYAEGEEETVRAIEVARVASVVLEEDVVALLGAHVFLSVNVSSETGAWLSGADIELLSDHTGTALDSGIMLTFDEPGEHLVEVGVGAVSDQASVFAVGIEDTTISLENVYSDDVEVIMDVVVTQAGRTVQTNSVERSYTFAGVDLLAPTLRRDQLPGELCVTIADRTHCEIVE